MSGRRISTCGCGKIITTPASINDHGKALPTATVGNRSLNAAIAWWRAGHGRISSGRARRCRARL
jgi:hypothetical protein